MAGDALRAYLDTYREAIESTRYAEIDDLQPAPWANLMHGGAGTAYVLWRLGDARRARAWATASLADRRVGACECDEIHPLRSSVVFGRAGLYWITALAGGPARARAIAGFIRFTPSTSTGRRALEVMEGAAGQLDAARVLLAQADDRKLRAHAGKLADRLTRAVRARARKPWQPIDAAGFAHFWPGMLHALLAWQRFAGEDTPGWLADATGALLDVWSPPLSRIEHLAASWCNGAAGVALLWAQAYACLGDERFRAAARVAGEHAANGGPMLADVCCGHAGVGLGLLAIDPIDPGGGWREHALVHATRAIENPAMRWPNGLYRGHPGLVCLALDLTSETPRGFPVIDG
jgi:hypothetical protein